MKLGAAYNFWDGEELLEPSIAQIYDQVDYIVLVAQEISNWGALLSDSARQVLDRLSGDPKINLFYFKPNMLQSAKDNEWMKRMIGRAECGFRNGCTHYLLIDTDEFYQPDQFKWAKQQVEEHGWDTTFCRLQAYYKKPIYQWGNPNSWSHVNFIYKFNPSVPHGYAKDQIKSAGIGLDGTRIPGNLGSYHIFDPDKLLMHRMSWVRSDLERKLKNSTSRMDSQWKSSIKRWCKAYDNWTPDQPTDPYGMTVTQVSNQFNINI